MTSGYLLVTRPLPAAERTLAALAERGLSGLAAPLFAIEPTGEARPKGRFKALAVTSQNGADGLTPDAAGLPPEAPAFAVGDRTADILRANGFLNVSSASGDQQDLAALALAHLTAPARVLIAAGEPRKEGLAQALQQHGHQCAAWTRYRSAPLPDMPAQAREAIAAGEVAGVLHFSRRAAEVFLDLSDLAGLGDKVRALPHAVISEDVAEPLRMAGAGVIRVAAAPNEAALIDAAAGLPAERGEAEPPPPAALEHDAGHEAGRDARDEPAAGRAFTLPPADPAPRPVAAEPPPRSPEPPPAAAAARRGFGLPALLLAGLVGGAAGGALGASAPVLLPLLGLPAPGAAAAEAIRGIEGRLRQVETRPAPAPTPAADPALQGAVREAAAGVAELRQTSQALQQRLAQLAERPAAPGGPSPAAPELAQIEARLLGAERSAAQAQERVAALAPQVQAAERAASAAAAPRPQSGAQAALVVIGERVQRLLAEGRPFETEARALASLGASGPAAAVLSEAAGRGVPTIAALTAEFRRLRPAMSVETAGSDPSWTERLLRLTDGLVRVRPVGEVQGSSPAAVAARIEQALARGDAAGAAAAWAELPEPARRATQPLDTALQARLRVEQALKTIMDEAVRALAAAS